MSSATQRIVSGTGFFIGGVDSLNDPAYIDKTSYVWSENALNRGGIMRTRPGFNEVVSLASNEFENIYHPQGIAVFTGKNGITYMLVAAVGNVYKSAYPFVTFDLVRGVRFNPNADQVIFENAIKFSQTNADGSQTDIDPYPVLMMQDGVTKAAIFNGDHGYHLRTSQCPIGQTMKWNCDRLWIGNGPHLHASNLGDPIGFTEEKVTAIGGFFTLPGDIKAIFETPDLRALLVCTDDTTTSFQSGILDRTQWSTTFDFQKLLFRNIGCVGPRAGGNQWGVTWWYSHNGVISLDQAYQTYRSSRVIYRDFAMARSKRGLHKNLSGICFGQFENFLMFSVPSGDQWNAHTWVQDQATFKANDQSPNASWAGAWKGIRPVQWITSVINGVNRCICLSRDYSDTPGTHRIGIWEAFCPQRVDTQINGTVKQIPCLFEGGQLSFTAEPKKVTGMEVDVSEAVGTINFELYVAGRRSPFALVGTKQIIATQGSLGGPDQQLDQVMDASEIFESYLSQRRIIRSGEIQLGSGLLQPVQSNFIPSVDLGFAPAVLWTGEAAINSIRMFMDPQPQDQIGRCEPDELTDRIVSPTEGEKIETTTPPPRVANPTTSGFIEGQSGRLPELIYSSR